jgi:hypothetical protein
MRGNKLASQIKTGSLILIAALALSPNALAQNQPQSSDDSVAKVVQKQKARKARIVLTDDDLPHHPMPVADIQPMRAATVQPDTADTSASKKAAPGINVPGLLVEGSVDDAKNLLDRLHQEEALLNQRFDQLKRDLANADSAQLRHVYSDALSHREETLARTRKKIADTEQALAAASNGKKEGDTNNAAK